MTSTLVRMAASIARGDASATELVRDHIVRSESTQPALNAYTMIDDERAMARAAELDRLRSTGAQAGPLAGVPIAIKDLIDHEGRPTTCGSSFLRDPATRSATVVERLESAGAVIIGRTGLHEFAYGFSSENHWWGPVRNPWDTATSPGGSSGGSAAAVAAGVVAAALGTDTGGSVRVPAAMCGIVGLKVTHGRVPLTGVFPLAASLDTVGPLARTVGDAAALYCVIAGFDPLDPLAAPKEVETPGQAAVLAGLRVGVPHPWVDIEIDSSVDAAYQAAITQLSDAGAAIIEVNDDALDPHEPPSMVAAYFAPEVASVHRDWFHSDPSRYGPEVAARIEAVFTVDPDDHIAARSWKAGLSHTFDRLLMDVDILVTPATAATTKQIGEDAIHINGHARPYRPVLSAFSSLVNLAGNPALVVPMAAAGTPPPTLQVIGPKWSEHRLLEIGLALEEAGIAAHPTPPGSNFG